MVLVKLAVISFIVLISCCSSVSALSSSLSMSQQHRSSNFDLVSCWSKAGVGTSIVLDYNSGNKKQPRLVLDIGATPCFDESIRSSVVLISHGHVDHIGAIFSHARAHTVLKSGSVPTYYVPAQLVDRLHQAREAMSALDAANDGTGPRKSSLIEMNIVGVHPGDEFMLPIKKHLQSGVQLFARVFGVQHAGCPAVGYVVGSRHAPKLKEQYRGLDKDQIRELISSGVSIKGPPLDVLELSYTGDTCAKGIIQCPTNTGNCEDTHDLENEKAIRQQQRSELHLQQAFQAPLVFCEVTFLFDNEQERVLAQDRGHVHVDDLMPVLESHGCWKHNNNNLVLQDEEENGQQLVLLHVSARYGAQQALDEIVRAIPEDVAQHCSVAVSSLLNGSDDEEELTKLIRDTGCISLSDYIEIQSTSHVE